MARHNLIIVLSLAALAGCAKPGPSASDVGATASTRSAVEAATAAFHQALRTNDAETFLSYVTEDVVLMPPGEAVVRGKNAMQEWYEGFLSHYRTSSLILSDREVIVGEGWAVELGTYEWGLEPVSGGDPVLDRGNYIQVWKPQPDGRWQFAREIWNSSLPPASPNVK
ncbi:MAG TPA: DUF4440 domain-containing protein [Blastocatellia bacterium]|nr:DUF4440 domain-containing protein [Blastocatellia bacterium]